MSARELAPWNWARRELGRARGHTEDSFTALQRQIDDLFDNFTRSLWHGRGEEQLLPGGPVPDVDLVDEGNQLVLTAELPGIGAKDLDVTLRGDTLILSGEKKAEREVKEHDAYRLERSYGRIQRSIPLPCPVKEDKVKADFKDGVLTITMPKQENAVGASRKIPVGGS